MIDMNAVNEEIERLEADDLTYRIAEKLAVLYTIRKENGTGVARNRAINGEQTEFEEIAMRISKQELIEAINEHVEVVRIMYPKEYELIIERMKKAEN